MKICFIQPRAYELFNPAIKTQFGGAEVQMYLHALELAKKKEHQISFIVADYQQAKKEEFENISVYKSIDFNQSIVKQVLTFYKTFKKIDADIYLQMTLTRFSFIIALYCLLRGKRFVYLISHDNDLNGQILKKGFLSQKISLLVFLFSSKIIAQNVFQYEYLKKFNISSKIIRSSLDPAPPLSKTKEYHLWVARAEKWKLPEVFISLAAKNPSEKFLMICPPFAEADQTYYQKIKDNCMHLNNLQLIEYYVSFKELDNYFSKAKIFINTSESEGFPTTFLHATKNGIPILSLSVNPDNVLTQTKIGYYCNDNIRELQLRFDELNKNTNLYSYFSLNAINYFNQYHNSDKNSTLLLEYITS